MTESLSGEKGEAMRSLWIAAWSMTNHRGSSLLALAAASLALATARLLEP